MLEELGWGREDEWHTDGMVVARGWHGSGLAAVAEGELWDCALVRLK